jgi:hypothetical protein
MRWRPRSDWGPAGTGMVVVTSTESGFNFDLEVQNPVKDLLSWLGLWLQHFLARRNSDLAGGEPDCTFFYIVVGLPDIENAPDGTFDGRVIGCGYGGYHVGPSDGIDVLPSDLVKFAIDVLSGSQQGDRRDK